MQDLETEAAAREEEAPDLGEKVQKLSLKLEVAEKVRPPNPLQKNFASFSMLLVRGMQGPCPKG